MELFVLNLSITPVGENTPQQDNVERICASVEDAVKVVQPHIDTMRSESIDFRVCEEDCFCIGGTAKQITYAADDNVFQWNIYPVVLTEDAMCALQNRKKK